MVAEDVGQNRAVLTKPVDVLLPKVGGRQHEAAVLGHQQVGACFALGNRFNVQTHMPQSLEAESPIATDGGKVFQTGFYLSLSW